MAQQAAGAGVKRFIFISSIKVNGEHTYKDKPFGPEDAACPQDFYGVSKAEAEIQLIKPGKVTGMELLLFALH